MFSQKQGREGALWREEDGTRPALPKTSTQRLCGGESPSADLLRSWPLILMLFMTKSLVAGPSRNGCGPQALGPEGPAAQSRSQALRTGGRKQETGWGAARGRGTPDPWAANPSIPRGCLCQVLHSERLRTLFSFLPSFFFLFFSFRFLGPYPQHMGVPRPGVKSELQLPACTTVTAAQDPSHVFDLHHSSQQCRILNPLSKARDQTHNLIIPIRFISAVAPRELPFFFFYGCAPGI